MPLDNQKLLGTWELKNPVSFKERPEGSKETFTTTIDTCGYGQGELIFGVRYLTDEERASGDVSIKHHWKYFDKMLVQTNNDTGVKNIAYWPVGDSGVTVYDDDPSIRWNLDNSDKYPLTKQKLGYSSDYNNSIKIIKSTLLNEKKIADIYTWLTENATRMPY